jgi:hypothetical protein
MRCSMILLLAGTFCLALTKVASAQPVPVFCLSMNGAPTNCDYHLQDPQNYDYNKSINQGVYDYSYQRQQRLLQRAIQQGQQNQSIGQNNLNATLPNYAKQLNDRVLLECDNSAYPAYDQSASAYSDSAGTFRETYDYFITASRTPYIYDQLAGQNSAFASYSSGQQQFADANQLYADAQLRGLRCQAALANFNNSLLYNNTQINSQNLTAQGQLQEQLAAQRQEANAHKAQSSRVANGLQNSLTNALKSVIPNSDTSASPRPSKY